MSNKTPAEQISKATWTMIEGVKDVVQMNLTMAMTQKQIDLKQEQLVRVMKIVEMSIDEGYHRGNRVLSRSIDAALKDAVLPPLEASAPKKKSR